MYGLCHFQQWIDKENKSKREIAKGDTISNGFQKEIAYLPYNKL